MSENKLVIEGKTIVLSEETVKNIKQVLGNKKGLNVKDFKVMVDDIHNIITYKDEGLLRVEPLINISYDIKEFELKEYKQVDLLELKENNLPEGYKFKITTSTIGNCKVLAMVKEEN